MSSKNVTCGSHVLTPQGVTDDWLLLLRQLTNLEICRVPSGCGCEATRSVDETIMPPQNWINKVDNRRGAKSLIS